MSYTVKNCCKFSIPNTIRLVLSGTSIDNLEFEKNEFAIYYNSIKKFK